MVALGLVAGACSKKDDNTASDATTPPAETSAGGDVTTPAAEVTTPVGDTTPAATDETTTTVPAKKPVYGGTLIVSGEAEVAQAWQPAKMQCDSYCQQRARTFFDPLIAINADLKPVGVLVDSFSANADSTEFTFKLRPGIKFTDGTPLDAAAVVKNLQVTGTGLLISGAITDFGRTSLGADGVFGTADDVLAIEATDDLTFTIKTGKNGDLTQPRPWPNLPSVLAGQLGLMASPAWLDAVAAGTADPTMAVGTGPFIIESYAPNDKLVVKRNPDYWQK
ncbi:MAG: hypothetical protein JWN99_256, partial [Ilumatobacteraceae bacterium]|nr:hypothetical protein [Ilumatobacteraceae bacterium]